MNFNLMAISLLVNQSYWRISPKYFSTWDYSKQ